MREDERGEESLAPSPKLRYYLVYTQPNRNEQAHMLVELDSRRRVALGRLGRPDHTRYIAEEQPDGAILLTPAVIMTEHEAALLRRPELVEQMLAAQADPSRGVRSKSRRARAE